MTMTSSNWSWTINQRTVRELQRWPDRSLQDALVGWTGLPDELAGIPRSDPSDAFGDDGREQAIA
jgi:hypothetical protein